MGLRPIPHTKSRVSAEGLALRRSGSLCGKILLRLFCPKVKGYRLPWGSAPYPIWKTECVQGCKSFSIIIARRTPKENRFAFCFHLVCSLQPQQKREELLLFPSTLLSLYASMMFATTPEPTVLPPSLIANRSPFSIAIGVISSISILMLSPGMTISTPSGSLMTPVTSVVLK